MNILMLVIKNTAAMDFALPLLCKIKQQNPQARVSVLYCALSRKKILRESRFYSDVLSRYGISQYDFADFLQAPYVVIKGLWRRLCSKSNWDSSPPDQQLRRFPGGSLVAHYMTYFLSRLDNFLTHRVNSQHILPSLNPDIVLFDNTAATRFYGREHFYEYFSKVRKKVVLLPHAPHHAYATAFTPFDEQGEKLPDYCEFWMPFKFAEAWAKVPERKSQFAYVGYPGMDSEWLEQFKQDNQFRSERPLRCLFIIRRFLPKGRARGPGDDAFIYDYDEFSYCLNLMTRALENAKVDIELIIKPHPSNDFQTLKDVFTESGLPNWRISPESVYANLSECDFVISLYSTVPLITAMAGIPTVLLGGRFQTMIQKEDILKQLYSGLYFYLDDPDDLPSRLKEVIKVASERRQSGKAWQKDIEHLRYFYPDGAMRLCLDRLGL